MAETVAVHCDVKGGLCLRVFEMVPEPDTKVLKAQRVGKPVTLNHGRNDGIDAAFIRKWMEQNADSDLVAAGHVRIV